MITLGVLKTIIRDGEYITVLYNNGVYVNFEQIDGDIIMPHINSSGYLNPKFDSENITWIEGATDEELLAHNSSLNNIPTAEEIKDAEITLKVLDILTQLGLGE